MNKLLLTAIVCYVCALGGGVYYYYQIYLPTKYARADTKSFDDLGQPILAAKDANPDDSILETQQIVYSAPILDNLPPDDTLVAFDDNPPAWFANIPAQENFAEAITNGKNLTLQFAKEIYSRNPVDFNTLVFLVNYEKIDLDTYTSIKITMYQAISSKQRKFVFVTGVYSNEDRKYISLDTLLKKEGIPEAQFLATFKSETERQLKEFNQTLPKESQYLMPADKSYTLASVRNFYVSDGAYTPQKNLLSDAQSTTSTIAKQNLDFSAAGIKSSLPYIEIHGIIDAEQFGDNPYYEFIVPTDEVLYKADKAQQAIDASAQQATSAEELKQYTLKKQQAAKIIEKIEAEKALKELSKKLPKNEAPTPEKQTPNTTSQVVDTLRDALESTPNTKGTV